MHHIPQTLGLHVSSDKACPPQIIQQFYYVGQWFMFVLNHEFMPTIAISFMMHVALVIMADIPFGH